MGERVLGPTPVRIVDRNRLTGYRYGYVLVDPSRLESSSGDKEEHQKPKVPEGPRGVGRILRRFTGLFSGRRF